MGILISLCRSHKNVICPGPKVDTRHSNGDTTSKIRELTDRIVCNEKDINDLEDSGGYIIGIAELEARVKVCERRRLDAISAAIGKSAVYDLCLIINAYSPVSVIPEYLQYTHERKTENLIKLVPVAYIENEAHHAFAASQRAYWKQVIPPCVLEAVPGHSLEYRLPDDHGWRAHNNVFTYIAVRYTTLDRDMYTKWYIISRGEWNPDSISHSDGDRCKIGALTPPPILTYSGIVPHVYYRLPDCTIQVRVINHDYFKNGLN
jgi:hypothetical protein